MDDVVQRNKKAWNAQVEDKNQWTIPVTSEEVARARRGDWSVVLTPSKPVPKEWFPEMKGAKVLALASGGGQQAPLFAAAGADVTLLDNSPKQLEQDMMVAARDGLTIHAIEGDMMDMHQLQSNTFDFIFHPCSNCFVPDVKKVWKEAYRVLKPGGTLISGVTNPVGFTLDADLEKQGILQMKHKIPYSDLTSITEEERVRLYGFNEPITFGHTLQDLIGGQIEAGFHLIGFYEDSWKGQGSIHELIDVFIATRALKPR